VQREDDILSDAEDGSVNGHGGAPGAGGEGPAANGHLDEFANGAGRKTHESEQQPSQPDRKIVWVKKNLIDPTAAVTYGIGVSIIHLSLAIAIT
jgi:hypothetical protein